MKMKKLVALATAAALCLGMSLTAFAADNSREIVPSAGTGLANKGDLAAYDQTTTAEEREKIAEDAMDWLKKNKPNIAKDAQVIAVGNYELYDWTKKDWIDDNKVPGGKALFSFYVNDDVDKTGFKNGATVYALHWNGKGYDIIEGKLVQDAKTGDWTIEAEMSEFSPIAFIKVMSDGTIVEVDWKNDVVNPEKVTKKASPKTGE